MEAKIRSIIQDIKEKTGIDITVFNMLGQCVAATGKAGKFISVSAENFKDNIYCAQKEGVCCFLFGNNAGIYMGVIEGCDITAKNYAYMMSSLIENALAQKEEDSGKEQSLKRIFTEQMTHNQIRKIAQKFPSFNKPCFVLAINCPSLKTGEVLNYLEQLALGGDDVVVQTEEDIIAYLCYLDGSKDYQSAMDFAQMLHDNIEEELSVSVKIGVGSRVKNAYELAGAFVLGDSAIKMGNIFGSKSSIFSYKEFIMMRMIEEIPEIVLKKYLDIFLDAGAKEILNDSEMLGTAEEFLANSLNLSETSRRLYMHRNTLMYRLDKIEKVMGLNIRRFSDAVTFRIILILYKHLKY